MPRRAHPPSLPQPCAASRHPSSHGRGPLDRGRNTTRLRRVSRLRPHRGWTIHRTFSSAARIFLRDGRRIRLRFLPRLVAHLRARAFSHVPRIGGPCLVQIYLPIAELPVNVLLVLFMGLAVGFISGMFGIGGGFLMTPLLIFVATPPAVAVASVASHVAASSFSGAISYWRRRALDPALAM